MQLNKRLNECAQHLNDGRLLAILSAGDVVAQELKYHATCLASLYNKEKCHLNRNGSSTEEESNPYPLVFSELLAYITEAKLNSEEPIVFRLAELRDLYKQRLKQLGIKAPNVNPSRLKDQILEELPELEAHKKGRDVLLAFQEDVGLVLSESSAYSDAIILSKASKIVRRDMLNHKIFSDGTYNMDSTEDLVPPSLLGFVGMVEHGADIKSQLRFGASKTDLAMAQLLQYICYAGFKEGAPTHRHSKDRETPFPIYIGLSVFAKTRMKKLIEMLHANGLSISYDHVLEISAELGDAVVSKYIMDGVVCPLELRRGLFTTSAMDNIDHNPSASSSTTSFHGTSISLFQHPTHENEGEEQEILQVRGTKVKKVPELPDSYANIKPAHFTNKSPPPSQVTGMTLPGMEMLKSQLALEYEWLEKVSITEVHDNVNITWSSHHADKKRGPVFTASPLCCLS